jgi:hypothetical protein
LCARGVPNRNRGRARRTDCIRHVFLRLGEVDVQALDLRDALVKVLQ